MFYEIRACPRGHRYRTSPLTSGLWSACPRCAHLLLITLAFGDWHSPARGCKAAEFRSQEIRDPQEAAELLSVPGRVGAYNGLRVWKELRPIFGKLACIQLGRGPGPVVWAFPPYRANDAINHSPSRPDEAVPESERWAVLEEFLEAARQAGAEELKQDGFVAKAAWRTDPDRRFRRCGWTESGTRQRLPGTVAARRQGGNSAGNNQRHQKEKRK